MCWDVSHAESQVFAGKEATDPQNPTKTLSQCNPHSLPSPGKTARVSVYVCINLRGLTRGWCPALLELWSVWVCTLVSVHAATFINLRCEVLSAVSRSGHREFNVYSIFSLFFLQLNSLVQEEICHVVHYL